MSNHFICQSVVEYSWLAWFPWDPYMVPVSTQHGTLLEYWPPALSNFHVSSFLILPFQFIFTQMKIRKILWMTPRGTEILWLAAWTVRTFLGFLSLRSNKGRPRRGWEQLTLIWRPKARLLLVYESWHIYHQHNIGTIEYISQHLSQLR